MLAETPRVWIDIDGVLADFDASFRRYFKRDPDDFRPRLNSAFYAVLAPAPGATDLMDRLARHRPIILTIAPRANFAEAHKRLWCAEHFPGVPCVEATHKARYCYRGDLLIDDSERHRDPWEQAGGTFILHHNVTETIGRVSHWESKL
jgi:5'(3')-deoxyribonucleotidase